MPVLLGDFGLARSTVTGSRFTRTGEALGTPAYMSPEQALGERDLTAATDVWALGAILYELLAGRRAFDGNDAAATIGRILTGPPTPLRRLRPDLPAHVAALAMAALARAPTQRHPSATAFADDARRLLAGLPPRFRPHRRQRLALAGGLGAIAASGALALGVHLGHGPRPAAAPALPPNAGPTAAAHAAEAGWALRTTDPALAEATLASALAQEPGRHEWRLRLGVLHWMRGRPADACTDWLAIPADADVAGDAALLLGLEDLFRKMADGDRETPEAIAHLRRAFERGGRAGTLASVLLAAHDRRAGRGVAALVGIAGWDADVVRALAAESGGDLEAAEREWTSAIADGLGFAWLHVGRGNLRLRRGDPRGATADFDAAILRRPDWAPGHANRGIAHRLLGELPAALADFDRALALDASRPEIHAARALARAAAGDRAGASADCEASLALDPRCAEALTCRMSLRWHARDLAGVRDDADTMLRRHPRNLEARMFRLLAAQALGEPPDPAAVEALLADAPEAWPMRSLVEQRLRRPPR